MKTVKKMNALDLQLILDYCNSYDFDVTFEVVNDRVILHNGKIMFSVIKADTGLLIGKEIELDRKRPKGKLKSIQINSAVIVSNAMDAVIATETPEGAYNLLPLIALGEHGIPTTLSTYEDFVNDEELQHNGKA